MSKKHRRKKHLHLFSPAQPCPAVQPPPSPPQTLLLLLWLHAATAHIIINLLSLSLTYSYNIGAEQREKHINTILRNATAAAAQAAELAAPAAAVAEAVVVAEVVVVAETRICSVLSMSKATILSLSMPAKITSIAPSCSSSS